LTKSTKKILSFLLKAAVVGLAYWFIYHQFIQKSNNLKRFGILIGHLSRNQVITVITIVLLLMLVNWVLESLKWRYLARNLAKISVWQSIEAVFCGLTWAIFTPNRLGEYAGRVMFLPTRRRIHGVFAMAVGAFGQNVITNLMGITAAWWFLYHFIHLNIWLYLLVVFAGVLYLTGMVIVYFHIKWLVWLLNRISFLRKFHRFFETMSRYKKNELVTIIGFCLARFFVFSSQYYFLIHMLIPHMPVFPMMEMVFLLFLIQSAIPSIDLFDVGLRSGTAALLFGYISNQTIAVMAAASTVWFVNLIIPAILGSVFVFKLNFFDRTV
jgi:hypothetical protein